MGKISDKEFVDILGSDALLGQKDGCYKNVRTESLIDLIRDNFKSNVDLFYNGVALKTDVPQSDKGWWFASEKGEYAHFANITTGTDGLPIITPIVNNADLSIISLDENGVYSIKTIVGTFDDAYNELTQQNIQQFQDSLTSVQNLFQGYVDSIEATEINFNNKIEEFIDASGNKYNNISQTQATDIIKRVDVNTGENVNYKLVNGEVNEADIDGVIFKKIGENTYKRILTSADVRWWGVKGDGVTDDRIQFQRAIDICSKHNIRLDVSNIKIYLNSYSDKEVIEVHGGIIELRTNTHINLENGAEIIIGKYFDNKIFVAFSGLNALNVSNFVIVRNVKITGGKISFSGNESQMRGKTNGGAGYLRRIGIDPGKCMDFEVSNVIFENGDLTNCICVGWQADAEQVKIINNTFKNLTTTIEPFEPYSGYGGAIIPVNVDHSTLYLNSNFCEVSGNMFLGDEITRLVGCSMELHGSHSVATNNKATNYLRFAFVCTSSLEKGHITNITISNNVANLTSTAIWIWSQNAVVSNVKIIGNNFKFTHVNDADPAKDALLKSPIFNGWQSLLVLQEKGGLVENVDATDNLCHILFARNDTGENYSRYSAVIACNANNIKIANNNFIGHYLGMMVSTENDTWYSTSFDAPKTTDYIHNAITYSNNVHDQSSLLFTLRSKKATKINIFNNHTTLYASDIEGLIVLNTYDISLSNIYDNYYAGNFPKLEFNPNAKFKEVGNWNRASYTVSSVPFIYSSTISAGANVYVLATIDPLHLKMGGRYEVTPAFINSELYYHSSSLVGFDNVLRVKVSNFSESELPKINTTVRVKVNI